MNIMNGDEQKEFYKNTFNTVADGYDSPALRFFPESAARLPTYLELTGREHVLDVATGTGAGALALAAALPAGRVTGIDFSQNMLDRAGKKIAEAGYYNVELHEMDMQKIAFANQQFDAATCCFGIFFIDDMAKQLSHLATKVKQDGKVVITSFFENSFSPLVDIFFGCLRRYGVEPPSLTWKRVANQQKCTALFEKAGLRDIRIEQVESGYLLNSPDEWWQLVWNAGFRGLVEQLDEETLARFKDEHLEEIRRLANGTGIRMEMGIIYSIGIV